MVQIPLCHFVLRRQLQGFAQVCLKYAIFGLAHMGIL